MKKSIKLFSSALTAAALVASAVSMSLPLHADNPTIQTSYTPDPAPMVYDGVFYFYTGNDAPGSSFYTMTDWQCFSSTDMQNWENHGSVLSYTDFEWADPDSCWAAQCIERDGKFYLYVTLTTSLYGGGRAIGVAVADSPTGPFKDAIGKPLCGPNWNYIDPTVFIDDDGQAYLYFGNPTLYWVKLKKNMIETEGEPQAFEMTAEQFGKSENPESSCLYTEGPWIYKRDGIYYMVYAASGIPETIDYATSDSPTGPWKYGGRIMDNCPTSFTIHPGIIEYEGRAYFTYHTGDLEGGGGFTRSGAIEEFTFKSDGSIPHIEATSEGPQQLRWFNPYKKTRASTMCSQQGIKLERGENGLYATKCSNGDYIKIAGVNFAADATEFYADVSAIRSGGAVELRLDGPDGELVGTLSVPECTEDQDWQSLSCSVKGASGVHDLYMVFTSEGTAGYVNMDSWSFDGEYTDADFSDQVVSSKKGGISGKAIAAAAAVAAAGAAAAIIAVRSRKKKKAD